MTTLSAIQKQIAKLEGQAQALLNKRGNAARNILKQMRKDGVTIEDLQAIEPTGRAPRNGNATATAPAAKSKMPAKYRDPATGATWSGHARPPAWIKDAKDRSVFLIEKSATKATAVPKTTAKGAGASKAAAQPKQARTMKAKYQDPASGATWSGAGRPPAWIAQAEDRSAFLVGNASKAKASTKTAAKRSPAKKASTKAPAKKVRVAKKVTTKKAAAKAPTAPAITETQAAASA
ncbi:H-NS histone family protein [Burkholderia sp. Ac-20365]|nr:H-NS histone family protein [Burkholderia sp. Ac-20365]